MRITPIIILVCSRFAKALTTNSILNVPRPSQRRFIVTQPSFSNGRISVRSNSFNNSDRENGTASIHDYISLLRPITTLQAVGGFLVGRLVILRHHRIPGDPPTFFRDVPSLVLASLSIYLSYGAGMAMNDCADASVDMQHNKKQHRSIASGRISTRDGWIFCFVLSCLSLIVAKLATPSGGTRFLLWNTLNLVLMASYAFGMQKLFLIKNFICGWLAVSPLVGASFLGATDVLDNAVIAELYQLAAIGFPLQVSREILKDIEDVDVDRNEKQTLPLVIGEKLCQRIAYGLVALINVALTVLPHYWRMFASSPPVYAISVAMGVPMCIKASTLALIPGQKLLKKSIFVLLAGMIGGLLLQS
ncbi:hypothetical protein HJC23_012448 [Cyclotella cryptica]|uniref:Uncharacterized protein n=1 Tax=Cyclotella cryptica TaxID=29204 RepID=A0ABD3P5T3_9STRA|eukprot:CCRYP_017468-RA/>CCRYP_017468-RA protein AED:0.24 eAED:0.24 QI:0/-1/0/1/-1/1/1/0/360